MERSLGAILVADIVGYSKMMEADAGATIAHVRSLKETVLNPALLSNNGDLIKSMGDGWLVRFGSAKDAVHCGITMQKALSDNEIRIRIGIHLGDIINDGDDIYGDGINVAARLESLANPREVVISDSVFNSLDFAQREQFSTAEQHILKNISREVSLYRWSNLSKNAEHAHGSDSATAIESVGPSIAPEASLILVLPLDVRSSSEDDEFLADGVVEDLISELSRVPWLSVIARNTSFAFRTDNAGLSQFIEARGVRYVIGGALRSARGRLRVSISLSNAPKGEEVWADKFEAQNEDLFDLQDELATRIFSALSVALNQNLQEVVSKRPFNKLDTWELFQRGNWHFNKFYDVEHAESAERLFLAAIEQAPEAAAPYSALATKIIYDVILRSSPENPARLERALHLSNQAVRLAPQEGAGHLALGTVKMMQGESSSSLAALSKAVALTPNSADAHHGLGWALLMFGQVEEAIAPLERALQLSPNDQRLFGFLLQLSIANFLLGNTERAEETLLQAMTVSPDDPWGPVILAAVCLHAGKNQEAKQALASGMAKGASRQATLEVLAPYQDQTGDHIIKALDALELDDWQSP